MRANKPLTDQRKSAPGEGPGALVCEEKHGTSLRLSLKAGAAMQTFFAAGGLIRPRPSALCGLGTWPNSRFIKSSGLTYFPLERLSFVVLLFIRRLPTID